jgi:hypothetical protein
LDCLNPVDKLAYLYFITNPYTDISGVYELSLKIMALETGIDRDNLEKVIIPRFEREGKILYKNGWIAVKNFAKHQVLNPKVIIGIKDGLKNAPSELSAFIDYDRLSHTDTDTDTDTDIKKDDSSKKLKPFYKGNAMRWTTADKKWWVIKDGEWLEFAGLEKDIEWK